MEDRASILAFPTPPVTPAVPRQPSSWVRPALVLLAVYWLAMFTGTHMPSESLHIPGNYVDKLCHFSGYFGLSALAAGVQVLRRRDSLGMMLKIAAVLALYGIFDETTQPLFGRDCELFDWFADLAGSILGSLCMLRLATYWRQRNTAYWNSLA